MMALKRFVKFILVSWMTWFKHDFNWISHKFYKYILFIVFRAHIQYLKVSGCRKLNLVSVYHILTPQSRMPNFYKFCTWWKFRYFFYSDQTSLVSWMPWFKHVCNWISYKFFVDWIHQRVKRIRQMTINLMLELL